MAELKPCKCTGNAITIIGPVIGFDCGFCIKCDDCGYETPMYLNKQAAIDDWNKRSRV